MTILDEAIQHIDHLLEDLSILLQEGSEAADTHEQLAPAVEPQIKAAKAVKAGKGSKPPAAGARPSDDFAKANLQVARVLSVDGSSIPSEKLYKLQLDVGGNETRQVVAGLKMFVPAEQLRDSLVVAILNLKPAKLAGVMSEAMVLAAEVLQGPAPSVRLLRPPEGSQPGDKLYRSRNCPQSYPKTLKSDLWRGFAPDLIVMDGKATFQKEPLVTDRGCVTADVPDGAKIR
eukprot:jgi/Astpho2/5668/Aster-02911